MNHEADVSPAELYQMMLEDELTMTHLTYKKSEKKNANEHHFKKILIDWLFEIGERF